jgi:hypothetical protein
VVAGSVLNKAQAIFGKFATPRISAAMHAFLSKPGSGNRPGDSDGAATTDQTTPQPEYQTTGEATRQPEYGATGDATSYEAAGDGARQPGYQTAGDGTRQPDYGTPDESLGDAGYGTLPSEGRLNAD